MIIRVQSFLLNMNIRDYKFREKNKISDFKKEKLYICFNKYTINEVI